MLLYSPYKAPLTESETSASRKLYHAAYKGNLNKMRDILSSDQVGIADFHWLNPMATTLTIYIDACRRQKIDAVPGTKLLVKHGANISTRLEYGQTAIFKAIEYNMVGVVEYLLEVGGSVAIYHAKSVEMIKMLTHRGADITSRDHNGETILHHTADARAESRKIRRYVTDHGVDINTVDMQGKTALHKAVDNSDAAATRDLCDLGASLDIKDMYRRTPLDLARRIYAERARHYATPDIINILKEEPMHRQLTDLICATVSDPLKIGKGSKLNVLSQEEKEMIIRELGYIPKNPIDSVGN
jgi:hypothetical protein